MRPRWQRSELLVASAIILAGVDSVHAEQPAIQCGTPRIQATFKATLSAYQVTTSCSSASVGFVNWNSHRDSERGRACVPGQCILCNCHDNRDLSERSVVGPAFWRRKSCLLKWNLQDEWTSARE